MQYGLIFCLYVSTWCIELLRCQALHIVISKLPLKYEAWFPSHSMTAWAISSCSFGIRRRRGHCTAVEVSSPGSHPRNREMRWADLGCSCLNLPDAESPWSSLDLQELLWDQAITMKVSFEHLFPFFKVIQVCIEVGVLGTWLVILLHADTQCWTCSHGTFVLGTHYQQAVRPSFR